MEIDRIPQSQDTTNLHIKHPPFTHSRIKFRSKVPLQWSQRKKVNMNWRDAEITGRVVTLFGGRTYEFEQRLK
ncbi:hypothetical protein E2C01_072280 [Portunus trituberculatus]|uniref:Uncharacterized protein n=1 Tax=Portunus trituberculatus TaxID=210409 RepID=A0A5B7I6A4_PORTR|nr:hypothetical protein [Portunus trituberculatus]